MHFFQLARFNIHRSQYFEVESVRFHILLASVCAVESSMMGRSYAISLALYFIGGALASPFPSLSARSGTLAECLSSNGVPVSNSSSSDFAQLSEPYNLRLAYVPIVIILPTTPQHVSDAVICAAASGVKVQVCRLPVITHRPVTVS